MLVYILMQRGNRMVTKKNFKTIGTISAALVITLSLMNPTMSSADGNDTLKTKTGHEISFASPEVTKSLLGMVSIEKNLDAKTTLKGDTLQQTIEVTPSNVEDTLNIPLELQKGDYIVLGEDEQGKSDGAAMIYNAEGESVALISSPVVDNNDLKVTDAKVISDDTIQLSVENNLTESTFVVLAAKTYYYGDYFTQTGKWITRDGVVSLSLYPSSTLLSGTTNEKALKVADGWDKVVAVHSGNAKWKNKQGLKEQFYCHYGYAPYKSPWNLEPSRKAVGMTETILKLCNP